MKKKEHHVFKHKKIYCLNCGQVDHISKFCTEPITSFGIIAIKHQITNKIFDSNQEFVCNIHQETFTTPLEFSLGEPFYFMVQRRNTIGFIDFIRGKYTSENKNEMIKTYIQEMTCLERKFLKEKNFTNLWEYLWMNKSSAVYINTFVEAQSKYNMLNIKELLQSNPCKYKDTEWIFPKGRKNTLPRTTLSRVRIEKNLECATREFQEESGFKHGDYKINHSFGTFEESFIGTNNIKYRHIYYIAYVNEDVDLPKIDSKNIHQVGEIKNLGWFTFQECLQNIRSYDVEKKRIIQAVHSHILDR